MGRRFLERIRSAAKTTARQDYSLWHFTQSTAVGSCGTRLGRLATCGTSHVLPPILFRSFNLFPSAKMEKRQFSQVSASDEEADEATRFIAEKDRQDPKKPRGGGLEEAETGQDGNGKGEEEGKGERVDIAQEDAKTPVGDMAQASSKEGALPVDDASGDVDATSRSDLPYKAETPGTSKGEAPRSWPSETSEVYVVLLKFKALTGDAHRDKWLERLIQGIRLVCSSRGDGSVEKRDGGSGTASSASASVETVDVAEGSNNDENIPWPEAAVAAVTSLEKAVNEALGTDFRKYNQKMRQLDFNLRNNALLAKRLLKKELEPSAILNTTPNELKNGWTAAEKTKQEPEQSQYIQMTYAHCSRCMERKVGVVDIIHAGGSGDRYQLECAACGHTWSASIDAIASLTVEAPSVVGNVGAAPWATAKFEDVEKRLLSPHKSEKPAIDLFEKATAPFVPVLEAHESFDRSKSEDDTEDESL